MTSKISISRKCSRRFNNHDFNLANGTVFLCHEGLDKHWNVEKAKEIEIILHNKKPKANAHKFQTTGNFCTAITILPDRDEFWGASNHGVFTSFASMMSQYRREAGTTEGWMEVNILR